jgi:hypothetical protein
MKNIIILIGAFLIIPNPPVNAVEVSVPLLEVGGIAHSNCTVKSSTPAEVIVLYDGGGAKVKMADLPPELRAKFNYDSNAAKAFIDAAQQKKQAQNVQYEAQVANALAHQVPLWYAELERISNQITALKIKRTDSGLKNQVTEKGLELQIRAASPADGAEISRQRTEASLKQREDIAAITKQISELELKAFQIRQAHNISETAPFFYRRP